MLQEACLNASSVNHRTDKVGSPHKEQRPNTDDKETVPETGEEQ